MASTGALIQELERLRDRTDTAAVLRRIEISEKIVPGLEDRQRADTLVDLHIDLDNAIQLGVLPFQSLPQANLRMMTTLEEALPIYRRLGTIEQAAMLADALAALYAEQYRAGDAAAAERARALYDEALEIRRRLGREVEIAMTAQNWAILYEEQYRAGDASTAHHAHALYDEALEISRRLGREVEIALTAQNWAGLYAEQYRAGDAAAAHRAHDLFDEALEISRRLGREVEVAATAQNRAILYANQYQAGDAAAAERAHALYDEALEISRRLGRDVEIAETAQNRAILYADQYQAGDAAAAERAHALYDEAVKIRRRLGREVEIAMTVQNWAALYQEQYRAGDASAADRAHALYDEAFEISRRLGREVEIARTAQNWAGLYQEQYCAGDAAAANRAHALYVEALKIRRRLGREVEIAMTAQNWAILYADQYRAGDASTAHHAHALYDEALEISRRLGREVEIARTAQNWAGLYAEQYRAGDAAAAERAHALYDEALEIRRRLGRDVEIAATAQNRAGLYAEQYRAGDAAAAERAHALYDEALEISRRLGRDVEIARTAQNRAILYADQYRAGDAAAAERAHALYDEALEIRRRLGRDVEIAQTAQNRANLYANQYQAGDAAAAERAHALYDEALEIRRRLGRDVEIAETAQNRLSLFETAGEYVQALATARKTLLTVRRCMLDLPDQASRSALLTKFTGLGVSGAYSALRMEDLAGAVRCLEEGRAQQLGTRLREMEALLPQAQRAELDAARQELHLAERAADRAREEFADAQAAVEASQDPAERARLGDARLEASAKRDRVDQMVANAHTALNDLKAKLGLDDLSVPVPDANALHAALGDAALVQAVAGRDEGWLLVLSPDAADWQAIPTPRLTSEAVRAFANEHFDAVNRFETGQTSDGRTSLALVNAFSAFLETSLLASDDETPNLWDLFAGPLHRALSAAGVAPAAGAEIAPEIVLCLPAELSMLPISAACDPETGRAFYEDYAIRFVPSLSSLLSTAARAKREVPQRALTIFNPIDDLPMPGHPAAAFFDPADLVELTGYGGDPKSQPVATWEGLRAAVGKQLPGYIAYFGHSHWDKRDAEGSGLLLAPPLDDTGQIPTRHSGAVDFDLAKPMRIRSLALDRTRLVFSASCGGAGLGLAVARDEMGGLPAAWLEAGAAGMISSLYSVYTGPAADVMRYTLDAHLERGLPPVQALRQAQMQLAEAFTSATSASDLPELPMDASGTSSASLNMTKRSDMFGTYHANFHPTAHVAAFVLFGQ